MLLFVYFCYSEARTLSIWQKQSIFRSCLQDVEILVEDRHISDKLLGLGFLTQALDQILDSFFR